MSFESELITHFQNICWNAEVLALKSVHNIELPLCGYLTELTSLDCINLLKTQSTNWSNLNQPSSERILFYYIITDYISCGLSSPAFYTVFHTTLQSKNSKIKLIKVLKTFWDCLFKNYEITSLNVDFVKHFVISLERLFLKISNCTSCIDFQCTKVISRLKYNIKMYDQSIIDCQNLDILSDNNIKEHCSNQRKLFDIENLIQTNSKENPSIPSLCLQKKQNMKNMKNYTTLIDLNLPINSTLLPNCEENLPIKSTEPDPENIMIQPGKKLNAFQIMMLNAKKRKTKTK